MQGEIDQLALRGQSRLQKAALRCDMLCCAVLPPASLHRMHFNAAILELHSRLHHLDVQREQRQLRRKQQEEARAHAAAAAATAAAATGSPAAATGDHARAQDREAAAVHAEEDEEEEHAEAWSDAASDQQVSAWFDDAQWQQKEAKAAVLAIRKHLRWAGRGGGWNCRL